ncbi:hypothetical protein [Spirillospora sp. NPDC048819]|uniref:hypothetical protein n=1 Tax=Spirillospora sp. NPDC048819 TaxID=3155268 RepID=UPI0033DAD53A
MSLEQIIKDLEPAHVVPPMGAGSSELLHEITATPRETARRSPWTSAPTILPRAVARLRLRLRLRLTVPLVAGLAAVAVLTSWFLPGSTGLGPEPAAALDIRKEGGYYIITVKDAFADPERYQRQLGDLGLDISLEVQPVSPGLEGTIFTPYDPRTNRLAPPEQVHPADGLIHPIERPGDCARATRCTIGLRIPVDFRPNPDWQSMPTISLGRKARPGERYKGFGPLNNPGEPLECRQLINKTVDQVRAMLLERGVTVGTFAVPGRGSRSWAPGSWYVATGWLSEPGKAVLVTDEKPFRGKRVSSGRSSLLTGQCPGG